jgi:hypothetical protein
MDPWTIAETIGTIIGAIAGVASGLMTAAWQGSTTADLNLIINQNEQILAELKQLPLLFAADLEQFFDTQVTDQGEAMINLFNEYMAGKDPDVTQIAALRPEADQLAFNLGTRGPCVYQAANSVTTVALAIHNVLSIESSETRDFLTQMITYMTAWAGIGPGMFGDAINKTTVTLGEQEVFLAGEPRGEVVIYSGQFQYSPTGVGGGGKHLLVTLTATATITIDDQQLTFSITNAHQSSFGGGLTLNQSIIDGAVSDRRARIQAEINAIKPTRGNLATLQAHQGALQKMTEAFQSALQKYT